MHIILGKENAEALRSRHIVVELESFHVEGKGLVTSYCVVPPEAVALGELPDIERYQRIHQAVVDAWNRQDFNTVTEGISHLKGKFGGELDSFYSNLTERINETSSE